MAKKALLEGAALTAMVAALAPVVLKSQMQGVRTIEELYFGWFHVVRSLPQTKMMRDPVLQRMRDSIHKKARDLALSTQLNERTLLQFYFRITIRWIERGDNLEDIVHRLPDNMEQLGIMKMAEDAPEVQQLMRRPN